MKTGQHFRPGETCPESGQYEIVDHDGTLTGKERTVSRGEPFPPTPGKRQTYVLADMTFLGAGRHVATQERFRPGQKCEISGQYQLVDEDGTLTGRERTIVRGEPFPPTPEKGQTYVLVDATVHRPAPEQCPDPEHAYPGAHLLSQEKKGALGLLVPATIYVQDPEVAEKNPELGLEEIELDWEPGLADGPTSARIAVVDYDADGNVADPARWDPGRRCFVLGPHSHELGKETRHELQFHQVNAWAVVQNVLNFFEDSWQGGLGRSIPWAFEGNRLIVVPHAGYGANACYDRHSKSLQFYCCGTAEDMDYACLSHDIIAHETGHAILDGIRPRYYENTSLQTMAFHEFVADLTAILTAMRNNDVRQVLAKVSKGHLDQSNFLTKLADEFGKYTENRDYVRNAFNDENMRDVRAERGPHNCSLVLTGAMFDIMREMARAYLLERGQTAPQALWHTIHRFRRDALRPLDYLPPVDVQFVDYARAVLRAHEVSEPCDPHGYRRIMRKVFHQRGLCSRSKEEHRLGICDLNQAPQRERRITREKYHEQSLCSRSKEDHELGLCDWNRAPLGGFRFRYDVDRISRSRTDAYRFLNTNREALCIPAQQDFVVVDLYDTDTTTPGMRRLSREIVIQYVWHEDVELEADDSRLGGLAGRRLALLCGGTLVFDDRGNVLSWVRKPGTEEVRCTDGSLHRYSRREQEEGKQRRDQLVQYVAGQAGRGWVGLAEGGGADSLDVSMMPVVGRQVGGVLRMEMSPHLRHWGDE